MESNFPQNNAKGGSMKRDIKLNIQALHRIRLKLQTYVESLEQLESASQIFLETIKDQDSQAYEKLSAMWEKDIMSAETQIKEQFQTTAKVLGDYIRTMESYIAPKNPELDMRVDRNDIWWNCQQIEKNIDACGSILTDTAGSLADYEKPFLYNIFEDEETNEARKRAWEEEENAERGRRQRNYAKLKEFRELLSAKRDGTLSDYMSGIWTIYNDKVVPFENTDDEYKKIMDGYYDEWKNFGDGLWDFGNVVWDVGRGLFDAAKDLVTGVLSLLAGAFEILLWLSVKGTIVDTLGLMPEKLDADVKGIWNGALGILSDPGNALEAMGQGIFDTADENGIAYSVSYVTGDVLCGILLDKGLGKVSKLGKMEDVADTAGDMAKAAGNVGDDIAEGALKGGTPTRGYSNFADGMSPEDASRHIANNEKAFFNEFSERASAVGLNDTQIAEAFEAMRTGDYAKMATYFDTSSPVDGAVFWSGNKEGAAAYANSIGGTIMEQTPGGQVFDNWSGLQGMYPEWDTPTNLAQKPIWDALSSQYANGAEGIATYAHPNGYVGKVWANIEKPILEENDIIIQEVIIDAK